MPSEPNGIKGKSDGKTGRKIRNGENYENN